MGNFDPVVRLKRWLRFGFHMVAERVRGLDFSMVYVGDLQRNSADHYGYSMTDGSVVKNALLEVPVNRAEHAFLDVGCGKGMCVKIAHELGFKHVAGLEFDPHLHGIFSKNMERLGYFDAECILGDATSFDRYVDFDVFYFYNPFSAQIFANVLDKIVESQAVRPREIWAAYLNPESAALFDERGFVQEKVFYDPTRDHKGIIYRLPEQR